MPDFRSLEKTALAVLVPYALNQRVRQKAADSGLSLSALVSAMLAKGLGMDPGKFGLDDPGATQGRRPRANS